MGIISKIGEKLSKTKENIARKFFQVFNRKVINDEFFEELEEALISADMGANNAVCILDELREEILDKRIKTVDDVRKALKQKLITMIDFKLEPLNYPAIILVLGVNGTGKTTTVGKLATKFTREGHSVVLAAADTFRAAAAEQLNIWADRAGVRIIKHAEGADPAAVVYDAIQAVRARGTDILLVDTAGRLHTKRNLMEELKKISRVIEREYPEADYRNYIVVDATVGQNAISQVEVFDEACEIDGIILTKLDGTAKGGVVIAISGQKNIPILYAGIGEGVDDLIEFNAEEFISAIL